MIALHAAVLSLMLLVPGGTTQRREAPSPTLGGTRTLRVYLPPGYDKPESAHKRYPVVYLLHGWPGSDGNWFSKGHADESTDTLIARGQVPELILVCPNGNCGVLGRTMYMNSARGNCDMENYIAQDVRTWVDSTFRTRAEPEARAVLGLSDGGTGALNLAMLHPDLFGACASLSADLVVTPGEFGLGGSLGEGPKALAQIEHYSAEHNATTRAAQVRGQVIYFDCGLQDESLDENRAFHRALDALKIPHTYREYPGSHTWGYWRAHFRDALIAITQHMPR